jgi:regulator of RNase E activity RraA
VDAFETHRFPCWARGINLRGPFKEGPGTINLPVQVGGMWVNPGDIVVGDADGLVAVSPDRALAVAELARAKVAHEQATISDIRAGRYTSAWVDALISQQGD